MYINIYHPEGKENPISYTWHLQQLKSKVLNHNQLIIYFSNPIPTPHGSVISYTHLLPPRTNIPELSKITCVYLTQGPKNSTAVKNNL